MGQPMAQPKKSSHSEEESSSDEEQDMNSAPALKMRQALREHPEVKAVLRAWWHVADADSSGMLEKYEYITLQRKVYMAMSGDDEDYNEQEAIDCAERDWLNDSEGGMPLSRTQFTNSLFELADVYTDTIDEDE